MTQGPGAPKPGGEPLLLVLSGPSGAGKDAVLAQLRQVRPGIHYTVNATSRPPRPGEAHGVHHYFVSAARFQEMLAHDELLEHAQVYGHWYGVPKAQVNEAMARGQDVIARVDVQGAATIRRNAPEAVLIFLAAPSLEELERRLRLRSTEPEEQLALRLEAAHQEMEEAGWFDYVVVNPTDDLDGPVARILEIMDTEHQRVPPRRIRL